MKKCIIIPDSFKGSMNSNEVCETISSCILKKYPKCEVVSLPIADGGEGTVDSFISIFNSEKISVQVFDPNNREITAYYTMHKKTAIIEVASVVGITLLDKPIPTEAMTFGVGDLILDAIGRGAKKIIIGLGGSCTTDAAIGMAFVLGAKFYNSSGVEFIPTPLTMIEISKIDNSKVIELIGDIEVIAMCDVTNPLYGEKGAAFVFGPQKGANTDEVLKLDKNLHHIGKLFNDLRQFNVAEFSGSGAAGGMGAGILALLNGNLKSGIELLLDIIEFDKLLYKADLVITGEGRFDSQTLDGKVISGVAKRTKQHSVPLIVMCGGYDIQITDLEKYGITAIFSINTIPQSLIKARIDAKSNLKSVVSNVLSLCKALEKKKWRINK